MGALLPVFPPRSCGWPTYPLLWARSAAANRCRSKARPAREPPLLDRIADWLNRISGTTQLLGVDWAMIFGFFALSLAVGIWVSRRSGRSSADFFFSGRKMPWWLLGTSMVATTFSCDLPPYP